MQKLKMRYSYGKFVWTYYELICPPNNNVRIHGWYWVNYRLNCPEEVEGKFSESAKILIETIQNTEEGSPDGIQKISKYFTVGFFKDMEKYYDTVLKSERVKLDTKAEMLVFARKKAKLSAMGHTIQSNLAWFLVIQN